MVPFFALLLMIGSPLKTRFAARVVFSLHLHAVGTRWPGSERASSWSHTLAVPSSSMSPYSRATSGDSDLVLWLVNCAVPNKGYAESMNKWLRKLRGIIGTGAVWGIAGLSVGALLGAISSIFDGSLSLAWVLTSGVGFGLFGFVSGVFFAGTLATLDGRRVFDELSVPRAASWGWIAGAAFAALFVLIRSPRGTRRLCDLGGVRSHVRASTPLNPER